MARLIHRVFLRDAHLMDFYSLMNLVLNCFDDVDLEQLHLQKEVDTFKMVFLDFKKSIRQSRKTGFTKKIKATETTLNQIIRGLYLLIKGWMLLPDKSLSEPAMLLKNKINQHSKAIHLLPQREKMGAINSFLKGLQNEDDAKLIQQLGLESVIHQLTETCALFEQLYVARSTKESEFVVGLTQQKRHTMQLQFERVCALIEANAVIYGAEPYRSLANRINVEVAKINDLKKNKLHQKKEE